MLLIPVLTIALIIFGVGVLGLVLNKRNIIVMLMSIELMLLAVNLNFTTYSIYLQDLAGQFYALLVLTVAASESAIGLAILVVYYRVRGTIETSTIKLMRG